MRIGLFIPTNRSNYNTVSASIWIRVFQMKAFYQQYGAKVYLNNPFLSYDIAIVFRLPSRKHFWLIKLLKKTSGKVFFDSVVNYFDRHKNNSKQNEYYQKKIAEICDGVICSTESIAQAAKSYNDTVFVMDDPINEKHFEPLIQTFNSESPVFGWSGFSKKADVLNNWKEYIDNKIIICSDLKIRYQNLNFEYSFYKWEYETFSDNLKRCNIAFLPRSWIGDPYNSGHSSFKPLVYAVLGIPIIANAIPSYRKLATYYDGIIFLEDYNNDINLCLDTLNGWNPSSKIDHVRTYYSCENQAKRLMTFLKNV